ncbi:histone-lysine N-methyltransferase SUV39H2-like [Centruroides sculpturatus]|uniref:histone-lysine N-methyltransferase SUV39H2-like n=1 Tax=Centruroides sculpturatus TaxID=218467 RepID=UPI000C6E4EFF|nr:histone-lysine N-methyltransferase SUV39H2-like [Centruroides sculpturatus]
MELCKPSAKDLATLFKLKGISLDEFEKSGSNVKKLKRDLKEMLSNSLYNGNENVIRRLEERCDADLIEFARKRKEVLFELKKWETEINTMSEICPVFVENDVDLEGPPQNFIYITDYKAGDGIEIPDDPLVGCECHNCYENQKNCCSMQSGGKFAYTKYGYLKVPKGTPIYECNKRCKCGDDCLNRVVQKGRKIKLAIFRTHDGRGWGVKSLEKIKKGTFIMEYVGEVITSEEAERRGQIYDSEGRTYLFDLDYNADDCPFTVDAAFYGNVSHFMNHSCDPNLAVYGVWINNLDPRLPHIAFFSQRDIKKGEELTFDYLMTNSTSAITSSPTKMSMPSPATEQGTESAVSDESSSTVRNENGLSPSESNETIFVPFDADGDDLSPSSKSESRVVPSSSSPSPSPSAEGCNSPTTNFLPLLSPSKVSQVQARKRIVCKCGAKNCRGYLF